MINDNKKTTKITDLCKNSLFSNNFRTDVHSQLKFVTIFCYNLILILILQFCPCLASNCNLSPPKTDYWNHTEYPYLERKIKVGNLCIVILLNILMDSTYEFTKSISIFHFLKCKCFPLISFMNQTQTASTSTRFFCHFVCIGYQFFRNFKKISGK